MTYKTKTWVLVLLCLMLVVVLTACGNADFIGNSYQVDGIITIEYQVLNTTKAEYIDLNADDTVQFDVISKSGQTDIAFGIKDAPPDYEGKSVESGSFTVTVHEEGRYILSVTGSNAKGSVKLTKGER